MIAILSMLTFSLAGRRWAPLVRSFCRRNSFHDAPAGTRTLGAWLAGIPDRPKSYLPRRVQSGIGVAPSIGFNAARQQETA
jgi:hypothetical protein